MDGRVHRRGGTPLPRANRSLRSSSSAPSWNAAAASPRWSARRKAASAPTDRRGPASIAAEVEGTDRVTPFIGAAVGGFGAIDVATPLEQHAEVRCRRRVALLVRTAVRGLRPAITLLGECRTQFEGLDPVQRTRAPARRAAGRPPARGARSRAVVSSGAAEG